MDAAARDRANGSVSKREVNEDRLKEAAVKDGEQKQQQKERQEGGAKENMKNGFRRFLQDLTTPRHFLFKMIFFTHLAG